MRRTPQQSRRRLIIFGSLLIGLILAFLNVIQSKDYNIVSASPNSYIYPKQLRPVEYHDNKAICAAPKKDYAGCLAYETTTNSGKPLSGSPAISAGYGPVQYHTAYNLPCTPGGSVAPVCSTPSSFGPQTIAVVDAGNISIGGATVENTLAAYDTEFGLPACTTANGCLEVLNQEGATSPLPASAGSGWETEISLDIETAHEICQTCKIALVEANSANDTDLFTAEAVAAGLNPISISNSWGIAFEELSWASSFNFPGIAVVAADGDNGSEESGGVFFPSDLPDVVSVSGTTLNLNVDNTKSSETMWSGSGSGCSTDYSAPSWQTALANWSTGGCTTQRSFGDVAADANPSTGAAIYADGNWLEVGGTSLATPLIASMFALVGSIPSGSTANSIPYDSYTSNNFYDITSGSDCTFGGETHCTAGVGFDTPSGLGSPVGVGGFSPPPSQPTNLTTPSISSPTSVSLSWTSSSGNVAINNYSIYRGGVLIGTSSTNSYVDSGISVNQNYTYYIMANDVLGNTSPASGTISANTFYPEDLNEDGHINLLDFSLLASKFDQSGAGVGRADINHDGVVNLLDFSLLATEYAKE